MKRYAFFALSMITSALFAQMADKIDSLATAGLDKVDIVVIGYEDENKKPSAVIKGNPNIINRYSLAQFPLKRFPEAGKVYAYVIQNGVFIEKPEVELDLGNKLATLAGNNNP